MTSHTFEILKNIRAKLGNVYSLLYKLDKNYST